MFVNKHCIVLLYNAVMKAREEALSGIQAKMDEVAEEIRDCYFKLGNTIASSPEALGIPVGKRLLGYASLVLDNDLSGALSGESAKSVYEECTACSSEIKELSARLSEISGYLDRSDSEKKALDKGGYEKLKADSDDKSDKLKEEIIGYGNYLFDRGASWIDQSTPSEILDYLDSILKSQNEYSALSNTLNRMMKEAKADDYKAQIEEEKARILILQKEKERIDLQISQIQAEIDRLEGTVDRLSMN